MSVTSSTSERLSLSVPPSFPAGRKRQYSLEKSQCAFLRNEKILMTQHVLISTTKLGKDCYKWQLKITPSGFFSATNFWIDMRQKKKKNEGGRGNAVVPEKSYCLQKWYQFALFILSPQATCQESRLGSAHCRSSVSKANFSICIKISISCLLLSNITLPVKALWGIAC